MRECIKVNVIIPTRERADTLYHSLRTVVEQEYANLNIIVSDNFSQDNTREVVASFADPRIKYINTGERVSMSHNWEFALSHVQQGWVTFLGDDDGILPGGIARVAEVMNETNSSAITSRWGFYYWPGSTATENQLTIPIASGYEIRNATQWLTKFMRGDAQYFDLPWLYTGGFVDLALINSARHENGTFFCSMTPDVYSAIALASKTPNYVMLHEPICVMGVSSHSNGASNFGASKSLEPAKKFFSEGNIPFHVKLNGERVKAIEIISYECYLQSTHLHHDVLKVDIGSQLARALANSSNEYYPELKKYCEDTACKNGIDIKEIENRSKKIKQKKWMHREAVDALLKNLTIDSKQYSVRDVYGATHLSKMLYKFNSVDNYWHLFKFITLIKKSCHFFLRKMIGA